MSTHDTDNKDRGSAGQADFLNLVEGNADIAATSKANDEGPTQDTPSHITVIADSHDNVADTERAKAAETLANRDNLEAIAFECLAHGLSDRRVVSLLHVLGWPEQFSCFAVGGTAASTFKQAASTIHRKAHDLGSEHCLVGRSNGLTIGVIVVQSAATPEVTCTAVMPAFDKAKPVCLGPTRRDAGGAARTLGATLSAFHVMPAIHPLPRPARAADMLPERALIGDQDAIDELYQNVYQSLKSGNENDPTLQTVAAFLSSGGSLDTTGKELNVHPNTVRYRIKRAADATGWDANDPRDAYVLRTAIIIGAIRDAQNKNAQNSDAHVESDV
ncbi:helix-turn-helix domain-containing protein [Bifidobacterium sp. ESL0775]|uniref:PucR family transcriptional regulator n=1 Tax=Bifidobacterium sp. ESL0775 TaxID=2983230 RepID=UPI0023F8FF24|nr:helix-turn-helix domain-containing protein [Bifidobacterium sp. ESL0775]WEV69663.1 helix-turn-helix domain-containing protein [Bifidobacterium sp. ESL0775]